MRKLVFLTMFLASASAAEVTTGEPAPDFTLTDIHAQTHKLSQYKGKTVVLEWLNYECPFVKKHYSTGNMQKLQEEAKAQGVIWLSIISSAPGKPGHFSPAEISARNAQAGAHPTAILTDFDGKVGKKYGAKTTPHMGIVAKDGALVYQGAIDDKPTTENEDVKTAKNYVRQALADLKAGKKVSVSPSQSYGCGVKY